MNDAEHGMPAHSVVFTPVPVVVVALGANRGEPRAVVLAAMARLRERSGAGFRASGLYRSSPVDCPPDSPEFINAAVRMSALDGETPESLLLYLQRIERAFGRVRGQPRNSPRELDLDLILFGCELRNTQALQLPHPRAHVRRFVLEPMAEVAGEVIWPGLKAEVGVLCTALRARQAGQPAADGGPAELLERLLD